MSGILQLRRQAAFTMIIAVCLVGLPAQAKYSGGTGEPNDPYQIATPEDLIALGNEPNDYDKHFVLTHDIDLDPNLPGGRVFDKAVIAPTAYLVSPKGSLYPSGVCFSGVFDGHDHTISHLIIDGDSFLGLFGRLAPEANITSLGVTDVNITGSGYHVGGLVGHVDRGSITGCYATGSTRGNHQVGGLVGANESGTLNACYATGPADGNVFVGGLVGYNHGTISSCYSTGSVSGGTDVGGLLGYTVRGSIANCYATGSVSGSQWNAGGLVGRSFGSSLTACYSTGLVTGTSNVGGLVGFNESDSSVTACFWDSEAAGQTASAGGTGKTTAEMQDPNTFMAAGWDFVGETAQGTADFWWIVEDKDYPRLWWERQPVIELDATNFDAQIAHGVILVDFYATWCSHCTTQAPIVEQVAERVKGRALVGKLDVDKARAIAQRYGVYSIPTLIVFQEGVAVKRFVGVTSADVLVSAILAVVESMGQ